jgi:hypothetical protein
MSGRAQNFFEDACVIAKNEFDTFEHLWDGWTDWAEDCREYVGTKKAFGQKLKERGFQAIRYGPDKALTYVGIRCIRENAEKLMAEAKRRTEELKQQAEEERRRRAQ